MKKEPDYQFWGENEEEDKILREMNIRLTFKDWLEDPEEDKIWNNYL